MSQSRIPRNDGQTVAIIGAGMAGLTCGQSLKKAGFEVSLFDKARGPGGRVCTRRRGDDHFDHGAQFITAHGEPFGQTLKTWQAAGIITPWDARFAMGSADALKEIQPHRVRWVGTPRMSQIGRHLSRDLELHLQHRVTRLSKAETGWWIETAEKQTYGPYTVVVLTCPGPQAQALIPADMPLKEHAGRLRYLPCWTLMLTFENPVDFPYDGVQMSDYPIGWMARNNSKPGRPEKECWVVQGAPAWSQAHVDSSPEAARSALLDAFTALTSATPSAVSHHRWLYALADEPLSSIQTYDASHRIGLCGDGTAAPRVEGAWLSGQSLAQQIISSC